MGLKIYSPTPIYGMNDCLHSGYIIVLCSNFGKIEQKKRLLVVSQGNEWMIIRREKGILDE